MSASGWLACGQERIRRASGRALASSPSSEEFQEAVAFLAAVRCFLHYRHERDDNTLDWQAQDAAAQAADRVAGNGTRQRRCSVLDAGVLPSCAGG